jgi:ribosome recycling factor
MLIKELMETTEMEMDEALDATRHELAMIRTGRASPALVDGINVECYGGKSPLKQIAGVSVPEARLIVIQPYDPTILQDIEKAIQKSDIGLTPNSDGKVIRLSIPALTEERRKDLVKQVKKLGEEGKVRIRNIRRKANDEIKQGEKDGDIPEDESKRTIDRIQEMTDDYIKKIDAVIEDKSKEIQDF